MAQQQRCPYCSAAQSRCATASATGRFVTECSACGRVIQERQTHTHSLFLLRAHINPLPIVTPDLQQFHNYTNDDGVNDDEDPFRPTGFITAFSTFSLEPGPVPARSASSFAGHLAELERALLDSSSSSSSSSVPAPMVSVDHLRAYLQIIDVASILGLDHDISEHAFQLFKDCSSVTCLRNRSVEALATAALVQAIREAQEPRTLQEISTASNLPQKEIGKYMKILGEALKLSQPINSNSISVHMPRFCTLLQLNKSAQELAAHIGEVVINKCFCTRRNPISISAAAIYLACQLEDKRKTQAEICKVTGLTEVTLRKVYKELLENWDDLLPPNYTPAVPPEKAFPMTSIASGRFSTPKVEMLDMSHLSIHQDKLPEIRRPTKALDVVEIDHQGKVKEEMEHKSSAHDRSLASLYTRDLNQAAFWQPPFQFSGSNSKQVEKDPKGGQGRRGDEANPMHSDSEQRVKADANANSTPIWLGQTSTVSSPQRYVNPWQSNMHAPSNAHFGEAQTGFDSESGHQVFGNKPGGEAANG